MKTSGHFGLLFRIFCVGSLKRFVLVGISQTCEDFVRNKSEIARNNVGGHQLVMKCALIRLVSYAEKVYRNHRESVLVLEK